MNAQPIRLAAGFVLLAGIAAAQAGDLAQAHLLHDFGGLVRYGSEAAELGPPKPGENRVVFLGDAVTELWGQGSAKFFPGKPYVNRGIARQTTAQMLVRFHQDAVALKPKVVVIQAGMNDLLVATEGVMADNFMTMMDIARANGIRVVLASGTIISLNRWIQDFA